MPKKTLENLISLVNSKESSLNKSRKTVQFIGLFLTFYIFSPLSIMLLWNYLSPNIFGFKDINFIQALALKLLIYNLVKIAPDNINNSD